MGTTGTYAGSCTFRGWAKDPRNSQPITGTVVDVLATSTGAIRVQLDGGMDDREPARPRGALIVLSPELVRAIVLLGLPEDAIKALSVCDGRRR